MQIIKPHQVNDAKYVICSVVHEIFHGPPTPEQIQKLICAYDSKGELADVDDFQQHYLDNGGLFLVLMDDDKVVGTGAIRRLDSETAELKRMWFLPEYRGRGLGRQMAEKLIAFARSKEYRRVRLDTDAKQLAAIRLYERLGFKPIARYNQSVCDLFFELEL